MHFSCRSFIGKSATNSWYQFWENEPDDSSLIENRGHLFGLLGLSSASDSIDPKEIGRSFIASLNQFYFVKSLLTPPDQLAQAMQASIKLYPQITIDCLSLVVIHLSTAHLYCHTGSSINLLRLNQISRLLTTSSPLHQLSGPLLANDRLIIVTDTLVDLATWPIIKQTASLPEISAVEETISTFINQLPDQQKTALSLITIHSEDGQVATSASVLPTTQSPRSPLSLSWFKRLHPPDVTVRHQPAPVNQRQRLNLIIGFILLIALSTSILIGYQNNQVKQKETKFQQLSQELSKTLEEGNSIKNLSLDTAKQFGQKGNDLLAQIKSLKTPNHQTEINDFTAKINQLLTQTGSADPTTKTSWYDTSLIINQPHYSRLKISGDQLYLLDTTSGRLDALALIEKSTKNIAINDQLKSVTQISVLNNQVYGLSDSSVLSITKTAIKNIADLTKIDPPGSFTSLEFWNNSLYLIDSTNLTIWRLTPQADLYTSPSLWLKNDPRLPSNPVSLAINGKVWVLSSNGKITSYLRGVEEKFTPSQTFTFTNAHDLTTGQDQETIAFVDGDHDVYVYQKNGQTSGKYNFSQKILSLGFSDSQNALFVLTDDQKIYKISTSTP
jgi:hypothetical protein